MIKPNRQVYILDVIRAQLRFPDLCQRVRNEAKKWGAVTLIENAVSGACLVQQLGNDMAVIPVYPHADKLVRLQEVTPRLEGGMVYLPSSAPWLDEFKRELLSFPSGRHDHQVDAFSQLLRWEQTRVIGHLQSRYSATGGHNDGRIRVNYQRRRA